MDAKERDKEIFELLIGKNLSAREVGRKMGVSHQVIQRRKDKNGWKRTPANLKALHKRIGGKFGVFTPVIVANHDAEPTQEMPGSREKIEVFAARVAAGEFLFHANDWSGSDD